jgi:hypothetical protein
LENEENLIEFIRHGRSTLGEPWGMLWKSKENGRACPRDALAKRTKTTKNHNKQPKQPKRSKTNRI